MAHMTTELKQELEKSLNSLRTMRDEVRVRLHLAGMEAKDQWNRLEPRIVELENEIGRAAEDVSDTSRTALNDILKSVKKLRDSLH